MTLDIVIPPSSPWGPARCPWLLTAMHSTFRELALEARDQMHPSIESCLIGPSTRYPK